MSDLRRFWDATIYGEGKHLNKYPFDKIVSFVFKNSPRNVHREDINILEVGCGAGNNLWFAAREGFQVTGIDLSLNALKFAEERFSKDGLTGNFVEGSFTHLPFADEVFDLVIDRGSITCVPFSEAKKAVAEVSRVLKSRGVFFFNGYSTNHTSSQSGKVAGNGTRYDIRSGSMAGIDHLYFYSKEEILELFSNSSWIMKSCKHVAVEDQLDNVHGTHAEWQIEVEKV